MRKEEAFIFKKLVWTNLRPQVENSPNSRIEQHPFLKALLRGEITEVQYFSYLSDLNIVYKELEDSFSVAKGKDKRLAALNFPGLKRGEALAEDLSSSSFKGLVPMLSPQARAYQEHLRLLAETKPILLAAHAYVRYLGDLSGGMIIKKSVESLWPNAVHFYDFSALFRENHVKGVIEFKKLFKERLNALAVTHQEENDLIKEVQHAYALSGELFEAIIPSRELQNSKNPFHKISAANAANSERSVFSKNIWP